MSKIYKREDYLKRIRGLYNDSSMIKIITGILGCGKTFLLKSIIEELLDNGVLDKDIIYIDLDNYNNDTELFEVVKKLYKEAYGCVKLIYIDINDKYKYQLTEEEMTYLIIHIQSITEKSVCKTYN